MSSAKSIKDGETASFSVTSSGGTASDYEWSFKAPSGSANDPNVTFSPNGASSTVTNGHWFANPNNPCSALFDAQYTIKCTVTFSNGKKKSAQTTLNINALWSPAGFVNPGEARINGVPAVAQDANGIWRVTGVGTLTRQIPTKNVLIPQTSQFFNKANAHEQAHIDHWGSGQLFGSLFQPSDFYTRISGFTGVTYTDLFSKITAEFQTYTNQQDAFVSINHSAEETQAFAVSDPVAPRYLYQLCGSNQL